MSTAARHVRTFALTEEQELLRESAARLLQARAPVAALRRLRDSRDAVGFSPELWSEVAGMGWAGLLIPEEHGGVGLGLMGAGLIAEQIGRSLAALPFLSTSVLGVTAVLEAGSAAQKAEWLPRIGAGELLLAFAIDEQPRHAPGDLALRAVATGDGYQLDGRKRFVIDGHIAKKLIIAARMDDGRAALFLVDRDAPGVTSNRTIAVDSRNAADIELKRVRVPATARLSETNDSDAALERVLDAGRIVLSAELLGIATETFERTLDYLRQREQFGRKIGEFQALQHRAAVLFCEIELTRSAVHAALGAYDDRARDTALLASVAKAKAGETARLATNEAVQMHGGIGMTDEFDIGFFMKRARAAGETFGDAAFHGDRVGRLFGV